MPTSEKSRSLTLQFLRTWPLPQPSAGDDKNSRGTVSILAGDPMMPGTAILPALAAFHAGAGKVQLATPREIVHHVALAVLESSVVPFPDSHRGERFQALTKRLSRATAILVGPGMLGSHELSSLIARFLPFGEKATWIFDAGAMECLTHEPKVAKRLAGRLIITPHQAEMARLLNCEEREVTADPARVAEEFAAEHGIITVLKGNQTFIADPEGAVYRNDAGGSGLATSGSGDVLAGIIAGLAARGASPA